MIVKNARKFMVYDAHTDQLVPLSHQRLEAFKAVQCGYGKMRGLQKEMADIALATKAEVSSLLGLPF